MSFLPLCLIFHLDSLHYHLDFPHFLHFHSGSLDYHACFPYMHSHSIPHFPHPFSQHFPESVPQFPILAFTDSLLSLYFLRICFKKIVALVQKGTVPYYCITLNTKLLFTSSLMSSVLSPKIIYLLVLQVKKSIICEV